MHFRNEMKNKGFFRVENFFHRYAVERIQEDMKTIFAVVVGKKPSDDDLFDLYKQDRSKYLQCAKLCHQLPSLHRLANSDNLMALLWETGLKCPVMNMKPVILFSSPKLAADHHFYWKAKPHQDWAGMKGSMDSVVVWLPVFDMKPEHGYLEVVPGSHKNGLLKHTLSGPTYEIDEEIDESLFLPVPTNVGDIIVFSSFCIHRSGTNVSPDIRWAVNFRYDNALEPSFAKRGFCQGFDYVRNQTPLDYDIEDLKKVYGE